MALTFEFEEEYKASRAISISNESFDQDFSFYICGNFIEEAAIDPTYGTDDDITALNAAYSIIPAFRMMPMYDGNLIQLVLTRLRLDQIDPDTWKVSVTYGVPGSGGQGPGGYNQENTNIGPNVGDYDRWSNNFVQLGFNVSAQQETKTLSRSLVNKRKAWGAANTNLPFTVGQPAPIGYTTEGVEGTNVYARGFSFSLTAYFPPSKLTFPYVRKLFRMATTLNLKTFFGFPAGSVLFLEASASGDVFSVVPVTFDFQMKPNYKFSRTAPDALMDPTKDNVALMFDTYNDPWFDDSPGIGENTPWPGDAYSGWSIVDYQYAAIEDATAKVIYQRPISRWIHNVYTASNFDNFEL